jgi:tetratricopeptide (TPR) repeat protein
MKLYVLLLNLILLVTSNGIIGQVSNKKTDSVGYCEMANKNIANYHFDEAIESLNHCYYQDTLNIDYMKKVAFCYSKLGRLQDAKGAYLHILEMDSTNISALNQLAVVYSKESAFAKAADQYQRLIEIDPSNSYYHKQIAELTLKLGNISESLYYFEKAYLLNPKDIEAISDLIQIYQELRIYTKADSLISEGRMLDSTNVNFILQSAKSAYMQKKYPFVIDDIHLMLELTFDTTVYLLKLLGISYFHINDYQQSIDILREVIHYNEKSEVVHYYLGLAYRAMGKLNKSIEHFEKAIDMGISNNISTYYTNLAITWEEQGVFGESIKAYQAAYRSSKNKILLYHLARNYDLYYEDKKTALKYYELYLATNDTGNAKFNDYSKHRISEIKGIIHFDLDTLN